MSHHPAHPIEHRPEKESVPSASGRATGSVAKSQRVLVVEDNDALRTEIAELFRDYGYDVVEAADGAQALRAMRDDAPIDVVLLDLWMPKMDGWHFRLEQRRDPSLRRIPVVVLTADDSVQARTIDADAVIPKPFEAEELVATVSRVISKRQSAEQEMPAFVRDSMELIAGAVGHEIANPLTVLIHTLEHARRSGRGIGQDADQASIDELLVQCWRMVETIRSLRDLPPPKWHKSREVDLLRTVQTAVSATVGPAGRVTHESGASLVVAGDSQVVHYVCRALLRNAVEAAPSNDDPQKLRVDIHVRREGRDVVLDVHDRGPQIPEEDLPKIFSPDYLGRGGGWSGGIRLWFVREAVHAMNGAIEVFNDPTEGVHSRVRLPAGA
jgi:CheY-like chemotaxis protein